MWARHPSLVLELSFSCVYIFLLSPPPTPNPSICQWLEQCPSLCEVSPGDSSLSLKPQHREQSSHWLWACPPPEGKFPIPFHVYSSSLQLLSACSPRPACWTHCNLPSWLHYTPGRFAKVTRVKVNCISWLIHHILLLIRNICAPLLAVSMAVSHWPYRCDAEGLPGVPLSLYVHTVPQLSPSGPWLFLPSTCSPSTDLKFHSGVFSRLVDIPWEYVTEFTNNEIMCRNLLIFSLHISTSM